MQFRVSKPKLTWTVDGLDALSPPVESIRELGREELQVAYQPIVDLTTGATFAYEALLRCVRPGFESPPVLLDLAVKERSIGRLGRQIRDVAFAGAPAAPLFVNIHPEELSARWLVRPDDPIGFHDAGVYLEVTESAAFTHFDLCTSVLMELCARTGARLVVDDFGAGYSNLSRILDLEPNVVKLDLALIRHIDEKPRQRIVVKHMVELCAELHCRVVAEGIETLDELRALRDLGVQFGQGFFLARPAFEPALARWPAEMGRVVRKSLASERPAERPVVSRRAPTAPSGIPRAAVVGTRRVAVEEIVMSQPPNERTRKPASKTPSRGSKSPRKPSRQPERRTKRPPR